MEEWQRQKSRILLAVQLISGKVSSMAVRQNENCQTQQYDFTYTGTQNRKTVHTASNAHWLCELRNSTFIAAGVMQLLQENSIIRLTVRPING